MQRRTLLTAALISMMTGAMTAGPGFAGEAPPLKVFATVAVQGAFTEIAPMVQKAGVPADIAFAATAVLTERMQKGEAPDIVIFSKSAVQAMEKEGRILWSQDIVVSEEGLAVADNAPTPVIRNVEDFKKVVSAAPSIAVTTRGVSGQRFRKMLEQYGLTDAIARIVSVEEGFTATRVIKGEAAMAAQQISELKFAGAKNIVRLPDELQAPTTFTVAVLRATAQPKTAEAAAKVMASPEAAPAYERSGLILVKK